MEHNLIHCVSASVKNGLNKSGTQRYKCPDCGKNWTPRAKPIGRKPIGNRAITDAERKRKSRQRNKTMKIAKAKKELVTALKAKGMPSDRAERWGKNIDTDLFKYQAPELIAQEIIEEEISSDEIAELEEKNWYSQFPGL